MRKILIFSTILMVFLVSNMLFAQTSESGDTLIVGPLNSSGEPLGALNEAIKGDTTETGERAHTVYKLQRGAQYILTETIQADFHLVIVADKPDDANKPPIIRCGVKEDGGNVDLWYNLYDDGTFKNIWLSGITLDGNSGINWISAVMYGNNNRYVYDGCIVEYPYTGWTAFIDWGFNNSYVYTNNVFQYIGNPTGATWNGAVVSGGTMDSVIMRNNTYFDFGCFANNEQAFYLEMDHNTFVNSVMHPIGSGSKVQQKYTNNLFVNGYSYGDDPDEIRLHHDVEVKGIVNYSEFPWVQTTLDSLYGPEGEYGTNFDPNGDGKLTEEETLFEVKNNVWWFTQPIKDYWDQYPYIVPNPWMNNYTQAYFDNHDATSTWTWDLKKYIWADSNEVVVPDPQSYAGLHIVDSTVVTDEHEPFKYWVEENTKNVDPGIKDMNGTDELLAQNCINIRTAFSGGTVDNPVKWHGVDNYLAFTWPLDYDLSYTNTALQTGGTDGLPIGSLQWWPGVVNSIEKEGKAVPDAFTLKQNYPNPFNPSTTIKYTISKKANVELKVFNILGAEVTTLVNQSQNAGEHQVKFDATNLSSGIYFYQLKVGSNKTTRKMMLMK